MSVVNKMLRDLDARRIGADERAALPTAVTPLAAHDERGRGRAGPLLAAILLLSALAVAAWLALRPEVPPPSPAPVAAIATNPPETRTAAAPEPAAATGGLRLAEQLSTSPQAPAPRRAAEPAPKPAAATPPAPLPAAIVAPSSSPAKVTPAEPRIEKQARPLSAAERAEAEYRRGLALLRAGSPDDAAGAYRSALAEQPEHSAARPALAALLIEARAYDEAEEVLRKGTELPAVRLASAIALARLKVERNQSGAALEVLQQHAAAGERSADYQGFAGALLNRVGRPAEAVERYQAATRLTPADGRWWAGLGIALEAAGRPAEAREAFLKARGLPGLTPDLAQLVEQRLR